MKIEYNERRVEIPEPAYNELRGIVGVQHLTEIQKGRYAMLFYAGAQAMLKEIEDKRVLSLESQLLKEGLPNG